MKWDERLHPRSPSNGRFIGANDMWIRMLDEQIRRTFDAAPHRLPGENRYDYSMRLRENTAQVRRLLVQRDAARDRPTHRARYRERDDWYDRPPKTARGSSGRRRLVLVAPPAEGAGDNPRDMFRRALQPYRGPEPERTWVRRAARQLGIIAGVEEGP